MLSYGLIVFASVFASGILLLVVTVPRNAMKMVLAFSGAFLFAMSLLHLVPELYISGGAQIGIWILAGFLIQLLLEYASEGIEHGHVHNHEAHHHDKSRVPVGIIGGLCLHSFLEGMPLGVESNQVFTPFLTGIVLHNIPVAAAFMALLLHHGNTKAKAAMWLGIFAIMSPLGMLTAHFIGGQMTGDLQPYFNVVTGIVVGIFLHISTTILFETSENHRFNAIKFITILFGIITAWLITQTV